MVLIVDDDLIATSTDAKVLSLSEVANKIQALRDEYMVSDDYTFLFKTFNPSHAEYLALSLYPMRCAFFRENTEIEFINSKKLLSARYALSERVRSVNTVGILLNSLDIESKLLLSLVKNYCIQSGIRCYSLSIGILSQAKLANFPIIDMYITLEKEVSSQLCLTFPIVNAFEFLSGLDDTFFSTYYGDLSTFEISVMLPEESNQLCKVNSCTTKGSFYGLVETGESNFKIEHGASGWSRKYDYEQHQ